MIAKGRRVTKIEREWINVFDITTAIDYVNGDYTWAMLLMKRWWRT